MSEKISNREKLAALYRVAAYRPLYAAGVVALSVIAALLEGIGLSFLLPIIEIAQGNVQPQQADGLLGAFAQAYLFLAFRSVSVIWSPVSSVSCIHIHRSGQ